ncbi:CoA transferase [Microbacterium esteraromaticum]|uniref:CoA transferase n=1 Tax=Microbacterium esteraromaticum TaxID=57043 RepID=A0A7D7W783_9MICO|nr:CoA transferase [Microbacterium esteraromaticum]QMU96916.1 CoA transferase [Microbacterium esteraromaticum]
MSLPLEGIVVADFSRVLAGPLAATLLADLGATVIKVERRGMGDDTRQWGPPWTPAASSYFDSANRSKKSIELDFDDPEDRSVASELAGVADVVIENFRVGRLDRIGLGYADVSARNPRVVYCSISGFGSGGGADLPGYDFIAQAVGGLMSITGERDGEPLKVGVAVVDVLTSKDAVIGIQAALLERERSGRGQHVEVNLLSSLLGSLVNQASGYLANGDSPARLGSRHPSIAPYETLRCGDGIIAIACGNDVQFRRLTEVVGRSALAADGRFATNPARVQHRDELAAELESALAAASVSTWTQALTRAGVPAGRVNDIGAAFEYAQWLGLEPLIEMPGDALPQVRHPIRYSRTSPVHPTPPPHLGEHNDEIRRWVAEKASRL